MLRNITVGIDIGTYQVKVVVSELVKADGTGTESGQAKTVRVIGTGLSESKGLRHGYIINGAEVTQSIKIAISLAEKTSGVKIHKAFIAVGGIGLQGLTSIASTIISRADSEITDLDITKISEECEEGIATNLIQNRRVLHSIPLSYKIDGKLVLAKSPLGMKGSKLEIKMLFVTCIEVIDVLASPIAASFVTLSKQQKIAGSVLVNIGAETISMVVFENNIPISLEVFAIGSTDITHDIALGLKIPLEEAENVKLGALGSNSFSKKKLDEIIEARLSDMFELILNHLKKIGRSELLPAGIFLSGGGGAIPTVENFAKMALNLPSRIVELNMGEKKNHIKDSTWAVAYGLCVLGFSKEEKVNLGLRNTMNKSSQIILGWIKKFLP